MATIVDIPRHLVKSVKLLRNLLPQTVIIEKQAEPASLSRVANRELPPDYVEAATYKIIRPRVQIGAALDISKEHIILRTVFEATIRAALRNPPKIEPLFHGKCTLCGYKTDETDPQQCPECSGIMRPPDEAQRQLLEKFHADPNEKDEWESIIWATLWQHKVADDWYWEVAYRETELNGQKLRHAAAIYPLDPRYISIVHPKFYEYFCEAHPKEFILLPSEPASPPVCQLDGIPMKRAMYHYTVNEEDTRFTEDEIIHGNSGINLPYQFGSPKILACWYEVLTTFFMTKLNLDIYSTGKVDKLIFFPNLNQTQVDDLARSIHKLAQEVKVDNVTGNETRRLRVAMFGTLNNPNPAADPIVVDAMPAFEKMQSLEWYTEYTRRIAALYGATEALVNIAEPGRLGNVEDWSVDISNDVVESDQAKIQSVIDNQLMPKLHVTDWTIKFQSPKPESKLRELDLEIKRAQAAGLWQAAGFKVEIDPSSGDVKPIAQTATQPSAIPENIPGMPQIEPPLAPRANVSVPEVEVEGKQRRRMGLQRKGKKYTIYEEDLGEGTIKAKSEPVDEEQELRVKNLKAKNRLMEKLIGDATET